MEIHLSSKQRKHLNGRGAVCAAELVYLVTGIAAGDRDSEVMQAVLDKSPAELGSARRSKVSVSSRPAPGACEVAVEYRQGDGIDGGIDTVKRRGDEVWSFFAGQRRERRYASYGTRSFVFKNGRMPPDSGAWINWNCSNSGDFDISGCDLVVPVFYEKCIHTYSPEQISAAFLRRVMALTGKVNRAVFRYWDAGEVLFYEAKQGREYRNDLGEWLTDVTYTFAVSPNRSTVELANGMTLENVKGHEVVWAVPGRNPETLQTEIAAAYVSTVYEYGDFDQLNLAKKDSSDALRSRIRNNSGEE